MRQIKVSPIRFIRAVAALAIIVVATYLNHSLLVKPYWKDASFLKEMPEASAKFFQITTSLLCVLIEFALLFIIVASAHALLSWLWGGDQKTSST